MIDIGLLYDTVRDLLVKNESGHLGNDRFNRAMELAQHHLLDFLLPKHENQRVHEALTPFIKSVSSTGRLARPADLHYKLSVTSLFFVNGSSEHGAYMYATDNERSLSMASPIRRPDKSKGIFAYTMDSDGITHYPMDVPFTFTYVRKPATANRAVTPDAVNDTEVYAPGASTQLEWPDSELGRMVEVVAYLCGVQVNKSEIIQFIDSKKALG